MPARATRRNLRINTVRKKRTRLALRVANRVLRFGEDGRGSGPASSGFNGGWRESPVLAAINGPASRAGHTSLPSCTRAAGSRHPISLVM
jgi:hypothetical protein